MALKTPMSALQVSAVVFVTLIFIGMKMDSLREIMRLCCVGGILYSEFSITMKTSNMI